MVSVPVTDSPNEKLVETSMGTVLKEAITKERRPAKTKGAGARDAGVAALLDAFRADPKLAPIIDAYEKRADEPGRKFGSNGLKVNGKLFALFTQGTLVVKLPKERVSTLVASNVGKPFDPGHGRLMKGWLTVTSAKASWIDLAEEAHDFVKGSTR